MEHIDVVMSGGGCPAAYGARNVRDHMVKKNHSDVSYTHTHTHVDAHTRLILHTDNWMHARTLSRHMHKSPKPAPTHAQLMPI